MCLHVVVGKVLTAIFIILSKKPLDLYLAKSMKLLSQKVACKNYCMKRNFGVFVQQVYRTVLRTSSLRNDRVAILKKLRYYFHGLRGGCPGAESSLTSTFNTSTETTKGHNSNKKRNDNEENLIHLERVSPLYPLTMTTHGDEGKIVLTFFPSSRVLS